MGLLDSIRAQLRSVIEWENPSPGQLFYRWTDNGDEIKNASKLIVGPGQGCIFVYRGEVKSVISKPGISDLKTANLPFWTTVSKFMQFFESEHKVGIFFFRTTKILNQRWGTTSLIKYEDPKYRFPVGLKAFGNYSFRITDPQSFFVNVIGHNSAFLVEDFRQVMGSRIIQPLADYLAEAKLTYTEIDARREEIAAGLAEKISPIFAKLGFEMTDLRIEGTSFDEETMKRINRIADLSAEVHAAQSAGLDYVQLQQIEAMKMAAANEGGGAGVGMGLGAGMGFGNMMAGAMGNRFGTTDPQAATPATEDPLAALAKLKQLREGDLITQAEFEAKKKEILDRL